MLRAKRPIQNGDRTWAAGTDEIIIRVEHIITAFEEETGCGFKFIRLCLTNGAHADIIGDMSTVDHAIQRDARIRFSNIHYRG